ncbi:MAG: hypothetical protein ACOYOA_13355 [Saprospiraceae bacterium]
MDFFFLTGIFTLASSLFAWGEGWLFSVSEFNYFQIPMADLLTTGPFSFLSAYALLSKRNWGIKMGLFTAGMYIFGSVLVFVQIAWMGFSKTSHLILPSVSGFLFAIYYFSWVFKNNKTY